MVKKGDLENDPVLRRDHADGDFVSESAQRLFGRVG